MLNLQKHHYTFIDCLASAGEYFLSEASLQAIGFDTLVFTAILNGPEGSPVWARAWISNEVDGTLAETVSLQMTAGNRVSMTVILNSEKVPNHAYLRIESSPLNTKHVVGAVLI